MLATELNPFDLIAYSDSDHSTIGAPDCHPRPAGARCNDATLPTRVDMQNTGASSTQHPFNDSAQQQVLTDNAYSGAFYDPSSADGYSAPTQTSFLSAAPASSSSSLSQPSPAASSSDLNHLGAPNAFRDNNVNPSPLSSPYLGAMSPAGSHHRSGSHSSEATSPPQFGRGFISDPALSQTVGQMVKFASTRISATHPHLTKARTTPARPQIRPLPAHKAQTARRFRRQITKCSAADPLVAPAAHLGHPHRLGLWQLDGLYANRRNR